jgi:hypothetical protein
MVRSKKNQSKHNSQVRKEVKKLENAGYQVKADIPGYKQPDTIGGYRPDYVANKGGKRILGEVETPDSVGTTRDQKQQKAFKQAAKRSKNTIFRRTLTDD